MEYNHTRPVVLAGREEGGAVKEAAMIVGATVGGRYLGVWTVTVYDEKGVECF